MYKRRRLFTYVLLLSMIFMTVLSACKSEVEETTPTEEASVTEPTEEVSVTEPTEDVSDAEPTEKVDEEPTEVVTEGQGPFYGGTLVVPRTPDIRNCNEAASTEPSVFMNAFEGLTRLNAALEPQPELAESWEISEDSQTITFYLREGVNWHDGEPFTSADVKFTFEEILSVHHPRGKVAYSVIESIETPDAFTVVFNLDEPSSGFMYQVGAESPIMPKHIYENEDLMEGPHATCQELPIGTGPFIVTEIVPGEFASLQRNDEWWGVDEESYWGGPGQPYLDEILVPQVPNATARINGLVTGEFDWVGQMMFPIQEAPMIEEMEGRDLLFKCQGPPGQIMFGFNLRDESKPWADKRVRQAIAWAIDIDVFNERAFYGTGIPSNMFIPPYHAEYNPEIEGMYSPRDIEKAESLLDEAGYPRGDDDTRFDMRLNYWNEDLNIDLASMFQQMLKEVGINVILDMGDFNYWVDKAYLEHDYDSVLLGLGVYNPGVGASRLFMSDNIGDAPFNNSSAYINSEVDELWETYNTSLDPEVRKEAIFKVQEIVMEDLPYIFINNTVEPAGINTEEFAGFATDCLGSGLDMFRTVWWEEGRPNP